MLSDQKLHWLHVSCSSSLFHLCELGRFCDIFSQLIEIERKDDMLEIVLKVSHQAASCLIAMSCILSFLRFAISL